MKAFMDDDFLLQSEAARILYHQYAKPMPVLDYHCHIDAAEIAENRQYDNITQVWLGGDHYKWRLIRANGVPEAEVTQAREKDPQLLFSRFAQALPKAAGNAVYHWTHLELKRYFGIDEPLCAANADVVYAACNERLKSPEMRTRGMLERYDVRLICTTDSPLDSLDVHRRIREDTTCKVKVVPAFRPDAALDLDAPGFAGFIDSLARVSGVAIDGFAALCAALEKRIEYFEAMGCRASDHGVARAFYREAAPAELDATLKKARAGEAVGEAEADAYRTALLCALAAQYAKRGWVMELHLGCARDNSSRQLAAVGPGAGFDAMNGDGRVRLLLPLLDAMEKKGALPRTILFSLNPEDSEVLGTVAGCFLADAECPGKVQLGAAWWFNDTKTGMEKQLQDYANTTLLGTFVGMLTDGRSFMSYTRHEYFRRILCNFLGGLIANGEYPADYGAAGAMVRDIGYNNAVRFFGFDLETVE